MSNTRRVLIVEDDEDIASALARGLRRDGYDPLIAYDERTAMDLASQGCDAAIVDCMLGQDRGEQVVRQLRSDGHNLPIIMLSALSSVEDRARGLSAGADDYVAKPFEFSELLTRLKVQEQRRAQIPTEASFIDRDRRSIAGKDRTVVLTQREFDLLSYMLDRTGKVLSRGEIFDDLWLGEGGSSENVVDVYIGYLRRKLAPPEQFGLEIRTVRGRGFELSKLEG